MILQLYINYVNITIYIHISVIIFSFSFTYVVNTVLAPRFNVCCPVNPPTPKPKVQNQHLIIMKFYKKKLNNIT